MSRFRRRLMGLAAQKSDFVRVEYIETNGTQYIDTLYKPTNTTKIVTTATYLASNTTLCASRWSGEPTYDTFGIYNNTRNEMVFFYGRYNQQYLQIIKTNYLNKKCTYTLSNQLLIKEGGTTLYSNNVSFDTKISSNNLNLYIFAFNTMGVANSDGKARLYNFKIYEDTTLVRYFIPVLNKTNGKYGLFDLVEQKFYTSPNGVNFIGGREIIYDAEIEYLETQGNCNIPTPYVPSGLNIGIQTKFMPLGYTQNTNWMSWYNAYTNEQTQCFRCMRPRSNDLIWITNGAVSAGSGSDPQYNITFGNTYEIVTNGRSISVNGVTKTGRTQSSTHNTGIISIFENRFKGRCYYFKVLDNGNLILDCIPVRIGNVGYMYDKVSNQLFGNNPAASGTLILGADVEVYDKIININ